MWEFIAKYWLQELFGIIAAILGFVARYFYKQYKLGKTLQKEKDEQELENKTLAAIEELRNEFQADIQKRQEENKKQDADIAAMLQGVLALWKKIFLEDGRKLLVQGHVITYDEYMAYTQEHLIYNTLGGNHEGDQQFALVTEKYQSGLNNTPHNK